MNLSAARLTFALSLILGLAACNDSNSSNANTSPTPVDAAVKVAENEDDFQNEGDLDYINRAAVRSAVSEFVRAKLPSWKLKGVFTQLYQANVFWASADVEKDGRNIVIDLAVKKFFPESGNSYWKAVSLRKTLEDQLHEMNDADVWKKLEEAQNPADSSEP